jgi:hypothetical protein
MYVGAIWRGWGLIVPAAFFGAALAAELTTRSLGMGEGYYQAHPWVQHTALLFAAICLVVGGVMLNWRRADGSSGFVPLSQVSLKSLFSGRHSFFFLPIEIWGAAYLIIAAIIFLAA